MPTFLSQTPQTMVENNVSTSTLIYDVFKPLFLLTRICGFLPVKINKTTLNTDITWSWRYYFLSLIWLMVFGTVIIFGLGKSYQIDDVHDIRLRVFSAVFITVLDDTYLILTFVLAIFITPFTFKHFCKYLVCLNKIDDHLKRPPTNEKKTCTIVFISTMTLTVTVLAIDMAVWSKVVSNHVNCLVFLLYNLPFYCTYALVMIIEIQFWYLVHMLNVRLRYLNQSLTDAYEQRQQKGGNRKAKQQRLIKNVDSNVHIFKESNDATVPEKYIINFVKVYELLFEANLAVNVFYGINLLMVIIGCLIHLLVTPYDLYLELRFEDYTFVFPQLCWMTSHILRLLLVVEPCHVAGQEVKQAASLACKFLSLDLTRDLRDQFKIFATQLLHCPIQFTPCDLLVLNRSLLTSIAGGVTTYLVILFQFENH